MDLKKIIREIPDFPSEGVLFRDITTVLLEPDALCYSVSAMKEMIGPAADFDLVAGPESRGFIFGVPLAVSFRKGFVPVRKAGKLPYKTVTREYTLEYGTATIEIHADSIKKGQRVVIVDDLLATGGTCEALCHLIEDCGGVVASLNFLIELTALSGRERLNGYTVNSLLQY